MNEHVERICADLKLAARFLMEDGFSLEADEAVRVGIGLAELAGTMRATATVVEEQK
jgi:hypothetical protein